MKALLAAIGVLGLAVAFGLCEPAPASARAVTSADVQLVSEQVVSDDDPRGAKYGNLRGRGRGRGNVRLCR